VVVAGRGNDRADQTDGNPAGNRDAKDEDEIREADRGGVRADRLCGEGNQSNEKHRDREPQGDAHARDVIGSHDARTRIGSTMACSPSNCSRRWMAFGVSLCSSRWYHFSSRKISRPMKKIARGFSAATSLHISTTVSTASVPTARR